uniref:Integral membrane protein 2 n=1 Tax=Saccoglossus kowalevskii TaxID=10224 RepID=A0ABM0MLA5_SACKO
PAIFNVILGDEEQTITVNEEENIEIYRTSHSDDAIIIKDFNRRLEVIAPKGGDKCFVRPLRASKNVEPSKLKRNLENDTEQGVDQQVEQESEEHLLLDNVPIKDTSCFGETINVECDGREMYWMEPIQHGDA